jgi:hypothetical protein
VGLEVEPSYEPSTDEELDALRRRRAVQHALERLTDAHREALVLCDFEGRSTAEAAGMLGVPVGTVHSRRHHARAAFARALASRGERRASAHSDVIERRVARGHTPPAQRPPRLRPPPVVAHRTHQVESSGARSSAAPAASQGEGSAATSRVVTSGLHTAWPRRAGQVVWKVCFK